MTSLSTVSLSLTHTYTHTHSLTLSLAMTDLLVAAAAVRVGAENSDLPPRPTPLDAGCAVMGSLKMYCFSPSVDVLDAHLMRCPQQPRGSY
jgi:hypothetical protein